MEANIVFSSLCHTGIDQVSPEKSIAEARPLGKACKLGNQARTI
jgi:hypothetical protein